MKKLGRILLVDDDKDCLGMFASFLTGENYEVETARDGEEAILKFEPGKFDLVISDVIMPNMNGLDLIPQLLEKDSEISIIMISGYPDIQKAVQALQSGAYDYVIKPVNMADFSLRIARCLEKKSLQQQLRTSRGLSWALLISIPIWMLLAIALTSMLK